MDGMLASTDESLEERVILISNLHIPLALTLYVSTGTGVYLILS